MRMKRREKTQSDENMMRFLSDSGAGGMITSSLCDPKVCRNPVHYRLRLIAWTHMGCNIGSLFIVLMSSILFSTAQTKNDTAKKHLDRISLLGKSTPFLFILSIIGNGVGCTAALSCSLFYLAAYTLLLWVLAFGGILAHTVQVYSVGFLYYSDIPKLRNDLCPSVKCATTVHALFIVYGITVIGWLTVAVWALYCIVCSYRLNKRLSEKRPTVSLATAINTLASSSQAQSKKRPHHSMVAMSGQNREERQEVQTPLLEVTQYDDEADTSRQATIPV